MKLAVATAAAFALFGQGASAAPMDGAWKIDYACMGEVCGESRDGDIFLLNLRQVGRDLCGYHIVTIQRGGKVDEGDPGTPPSIVGRVKGSVASVTFRTGDEKVGQATIRLVGNTLHWKVVRQPQGESYFPRVVVLLRQPAGTREELPKCPV